MVRSTGTALRVSAITVLSVTLGLLCVPVGILARFLLASRALAGPGNAA